MNSIDLRASAGQVLVAGFAGLAPPAPLLEAATRGELGGVILFKRNLGDVHEVAAIAEALRTHCPPDYPPLVSIDQEGGRVARLGPPILQLPPARQLGALDEPSLIHRAGELLGRQLAALGITMDFAPVLDIDTNPDNPVIGDRAFGTRPEQVTRLALAFADGLQEHVLACGKHFPGHGDTDLDSHLALPRLPHDRNRLDEVELVPFHAARGRLAAIMTAHVVFESLRAGVPATLAHEVTTGLLREELGYDGCIISDALEMKAIADHYGVEQAACLAIEAGCDLLLICVEEPEWVERARDALVARADKDTAFARRLQDAAERGLAMRRSRVPRPITDRVALTRALCEDQVLAFQTELERRIAES